MRILLTNDDGVNARGLRLLEAVARKFTDDLWIVAPTEEQSGAGHSLTLTTPVRLRRHDERRFSVTGTPTDAVMLALAHVMKDSPPDLILSGVNRGANLAEDVTYSGTVSAAMECRRSPSARLIRGRAWVTPFPSRRPRNGPGGCLHRCSSSRWNRALSST
jgi:5'-nucleotidase